MLPWIDLCLVYINCELFSLKQLHLPCTAFKNAQTLLVFIRKTCPCNVYPFEPHFYIAKLGYAGVYLFFLFLL